MDTKIKKMREKLAKHQQKIVELKAQSIEIEDELEKAEGELSGHLVRFAANNMSGGIDEVYEFLRNLGGKSENNINYDDSEEDETIDEFDETEEI
jgi:uncharacterized membrane-anchored protein YhcB (DUF1043 family)